MKKILFLLAFLCLEKALHAQQPYIYTIKADSVKITNTCDTAELIIENHTQNVPGFLFNKGRGRTEFRRGLTELTSNVYLIGADTLDFNKILGGSFYKQGGNSFGTTALLGTKDNYPLTFIQNGIEKGRVTTNGNWLFNTTEDKGYPAQFNGNVYTSGAIYQQANVNIYSTGGVYGDARINIGSGNTVTGHAAIGLGQGMTVNGAELSFAAGYYNTVTGGIGILGSTYRGIAFGVHSYAHEHAIAFGTEAVSTTSNQFVCGGPDHHEPNANWTNAVYDVYFGSGVQRNSVEGPGLSYAINGSGGYGTNKEGGNITIAGGKGTGSGTPGSIIFSTAGATTSGNTLQSLSEKARIDANGNVGIGTSNPIDKLHVAGTARIQETLTMEDNANIRLGHGRSVYWSPDGSYINHRSSILSEFNSPVGLFRINTLDTLLVSVGGAERLNVMPDGKVGIGTRTPSAKLHIMGDVWAEGNNGGASYIGRNMSFVPGNTYSTYLGLGNGGNYIKAKFTHYNWTSIAEITNNSLDFQFGNGDAGGGISRPGVQTGETRIYSKDVDIMGTPRKSYITFSLNDTEKARIDPNGNIGIGTMYPTATLHVSGTGRFENTITTTGHRSAIRNITGNTTIADTDEYVFANATGGAITITLPSATGRDGQTYTIKKTDNSNNVNIETTSSQFIDGTNPYFLVNQWAYVTVVANGGNWMIVAKN